MKYDFKQVGEYLDYAKDLEDKRKPWESQVKEIMPLVNPKRSLFDIEEDTDGKEPDSDVYDSVGYLDAKTMRDGLVGYNVGPRLRWAQLSLSRPEYLDAPYVKDWLEECERRLYMVWSNSNFYMASAEGIMDAITAGVMTELTEDPAQFMRINYKTLHPKEIFIAETDGTVDFWYRKFKLTAREILRRYDEDHLDQLSPNLLNDLQEKPFKRHLIYNFVHRRTDQYVERAAWTNRPWISIEIMPKEEIFLKEDGFYESPLRTWRWEKNSDETYGRGPAMNAKPEIRRLSEIGRTMTGGVQKFMQPSLMVPEHLRGKENLLPNGFNYYKRDNQKIERIDDVGNYPVTVDFVDRLEKRVHDHFHTDLFKMLTNAERQMTAREISERMGEKVSLLSPALTGQNAEMLRPGVKRDFNIAMRAGWLPPPPPVLVKAHVDIDVEFVGPLAQAQQRYHQSHNINAGLGTLSALTQASGHMEWWDNLDGDDLSRQIMDSEGFPQKSIREVPDVDRLRKARQAEQEKAQQMAEAQQASEIMKNTSKAPERGSPAEAMQGGGR